jgi:Cd2+/Zn2+-exporting ATPase
MNEPQTSSTLAAEQCSHNKDSHSLHDHDHQHSECCPFHENLSEQQVQRRLVIAIYGGVILLSGTLLNTFSPLQGGSLLQWGACILMATPILSDAFKGLKRGQLGFPSLVALAFCACLSQGDLITAGLVAFFMIMADQLENRSAIGARLAIESLIRRTPDVVHLIKNDNIIDLPIERLEVGQTIEIRPGEVLSIDGTVIDGETTVDESSITGESLPVHKSTSNEVYAGTVNISGRLKVKVNHTGDDTTVGKVQKLILAASQSKSALTGIIETHAAWYTKSIVMLAAITCFFYRDQSDILTRAIAILIMGCPCSLVLATPSAMIAAITAAARSGILVKRPQDLETLHRVQHIFFDKTGTLTHGKMELTQLNLLAELDTAQSLSLAASLAQHSNHPHSQGLLNSSKKANLQLEKIQQFKEIHGQGVQGNIHGDMTYLGREEWVSSQLNVPVAQTEERLVIGSSNHGIFASFTFKDQVRKEAKSALEGLKQTGVLQNIMVTGDRLQPAEILIQEEALAIDRVHARCLPEDKLKKLEELKSDGNIIAAVGDGINDAPLLAAGHVGIAMGAMGSPVAIESSSIALMGSDLSKLPSLFKLSQRTAWVVKVNVGSSILFLLLGLLLSAMGMISPIIAALLHNVSALFILFYSAQLVRQNPTSNHLEHGSSGSLSSPITH